MDGRSSNELTSALFHWVNTFDLPEEITSWKTVSDGRLLWEVARQIDPEYFTSSLPEPEKKPNESWLQRWQNLKHVEKNLCAYLCDECDNISNVSKAMRIDLKALASDGASSEEASKLLKMLFLAAVFSRVSNEKQIVVLQGLGQKVMSTLATEMKAMEALERKLAEENAQNNEAALDQKPKSPELSPSMNRDHGLEMEEQLIAKSKMAKELGERVEFLESSNADLRQQISTLEERIVEHQLALDRADSSEDPELKRLRDDLERDREYIDRVEADLADANKKLESQERQLERFRQDGASKQELRDDLQLVRSERDEAVQKAKTNENLRKKIQSLQEIEKNHQSLQEELQAHREQLQDYEKIKDDRAALLKANDELGETIANSEQAIFDGKTALKQQQHETNVLRAQLTQLREAHSREQEISAELRNELTEFKEIPSTDSTAVKGTLEDELNDGERKEDRDNELRILRFQNAVIRLQLTSMRRRKKQPTPTHEKPSSAEAIVLQQKYDALQKSHNKLEQKYMETFEKLLGYESSIGGTTGPNADDPFVKQQEKLASVEAELEKLRTELFGSEKEKADLVQRAATAESTQKDKIDAEVAELNKNYENLSKKYEELMSHVDEVQTDLAQSKEMLRHAFLTRHNMELDEDDENFKQELKILLDQLQHVRQTSDSDARAVMDETARGLATSITVGKKQAAIAEKRATDLETEIKSLKREMEKAEKNANQQSKNSAAQQEVVNLKRENKLITTAWYDLQTRLQNNNVVLQRRAEVPKSWLGRQRIAVGGSGGSPFRR